MLLPSTHFSPSFVAGLRLSLPPADAAAAAAASVQHPPAPSTPAGTADAAAARDSSNNRRSFDRINRVAAAVAAEKERRRSVERQQRPTQQPRGPRPHSHQHHLRQAGRLQPAPLNQQHHHDHQQHQQHQHQQPQQIDLLLGRQRSASEGQLDLLLGPATPQGSVEYLTSAAHRQVTVTPEWLAASKRAASFTDTTTGSGSGSAAADTTVCCSSAPQQEQDMAWREELLQHVASRHSGRQHRPDPLLTSSLTHAVPARCWFGTPGATAPNTCAVCSTCSRHLAAPAAAASPHTCKLLVSGLEGRLPCQAR